MELATQVQLVKRDQQVLLDPRTDQQVKLGVLELQAAKVLKALLVIQV